MKQNIIQPKVLKGFRDYPPAIMQPRREMIRRLEDCFVSFGFLPIDTPALEYSEILLGKGSEETDKQMYRFLDNGERDVALRFDLTIPLARFAAMNVGELGTPFRRYHIAPVWRAEKPQKGRFREFVQCDFDVIGTTSLLADVEVVSVIHSALQSLGVKHRIRVNNRKLLNGLLDSLSLAERSADVLRAIDKIDKLGVDVVREELLKVTESDENKTQAILSFISLRDNKDSAAVISQLKDLAGEHPLQLQGIAELEYLFATLPGANEFCHLDVSIARGLDYYTGLVFETSLVDLPQIGSICSGGRYDNLASLYTKLSLPGVGASIGLDRLIAALEELGQLENRKSAAAIYIAFAEHSAETHRYGFALAQRLRQQNLSVETSSQEGKLGAQLKYADKRNIPLVAIIGSDEVSSQSVTVKHLNSGEQQQKVSFDDLLLLVK